VWKSRYRLALQHTVPTWQTAGHWSRLWCCQSSAFWLKSVFCIAGPTDWNSFSVINFSRPVAEKNDVFWRFLLVCGLIIVFAAVNSRNKNVWPFHLEFIYYTYLLSLTEFHILHTSARCKVFFCYSTYLFPVSALCGFVTLTHDLQLFNFAEALSTVLSFLAIVRTTFLIYFGLSYRYVTSMQHSTSTVGYQESNPCFLRHSLQKLKSRTDGRTDSRDGICNAASCREGVSVYSDLHRVGALRWLAMTDWLNVWHRGRCWRFIIAHIISKAEREREREEGRSDDGLPWGYWLRR